MCTEFDNLAKQAFEHISNLMGESAVWLTSNINTIGRVLYKNPTETTQIGSEESYEYQPNTTVIEYYDGVFDGLKKSVDAGNSEYVFVRGQKFLVTSISTKFDGKTNVAYLELHEE